MRLHLQSTHLACCCVGQWNSTTLTCSRESTADRGIRWNRARKGHRYDQRRSRVNLFRFEIHTAMGSTLLTRSFLAGVDTVSRLMTFTTSLIHLAFQIQTAAAMMTFFLAMALHPDIMRKAQHELDAATGRDRLPTFDDRTRLPFIDAVCKEVSRWRPIIPLGAPICEYMRGIS